MLQIIGKGVISVAFVCPSVCQSVAYIANNSRTQRPSVPKFGRKVPHLRCNLHTSFKVKSSKIRVTRPINADSSSQLCLFLIRETKCCTCVIRGGRGHTVSAESGGLTACFERVNVMLRICQKVSCRCYIRFFNLLHSTFTAVFACVQAITCCSNHKISRASTTRNRSRLELVRPRRNRTTLRRSRCLRSCSPKYTTGYAVHCTYPTGRPSSSIDCLTL